LPPKNKKSYYSGGSPITSKNGHHGMVAKMVFMREKMQPFLETIRRAAMELVPCFEKLGLPPE